VAEYLSAKIWSKFGMGSDATWWLDSPDGLEIGGSGLSATLRDYARFGLFLLGDGKAAGQQVLPPGWIKTAGSAKIIAGLSVDYGYMLWPIPKASGTVHEGAFEARGMFGQHMYLHPRENVVVVVWSAQSKPTGKAVVMDHDFFGAVVTSTR
jgi:CubicO group peptidase (beta-lactamase class C family)